MLAAGDTAKKVILKVRELINNKELFAFLLLVRVLLYVLIQKKKKKKVKGMFIVEDALS